MGIRVVKNINTFENDFQVWHGMARTQRTWDSFKIYFEGTYRILKTTRGKMMQSSSFHQANMLSNQVRIETQHIQSNILHILEERAQDNQENITPSQVSNSILTDLQM